MKKIFLTILLVLPLLVSAQTKVKETAVPKAVLLALEKTYDSYKVKTWYQAPGQYIAEFTTDGQAGRCYFTASGEWQYSSFPVKLANCPTLMNTYFTNNYPGYRIKSLDYVEEMSGDNYYRMIIVKKAIDASDCELIFDTRGKLQKSNAPDPEAVKRDYYTRTNPDAAQAELNKAVPTEKNKYKKRGKGVVDQPETPKQMPSAKIMKDFEKRVPKTRRQNKDAEWVLRDGTEWVAYYTNNQKARLESVYSNETETLIKTGKYLPKERYTNGIRKFLEEKFQDESYNIEKMVVYEYDAKYRGPDGKKPKPVTYVVVSQKIRKGQMKYTRMEFDNNARFLGLLNQPLDAKDIQ